MIWGLWLQSCERLCFCCLKPLGMNTLYIMQDGRVSWVPCRPSVGTPRVLDLCKWTLLPYCWSPNPWLYPQLPVCSDVPQSLLFFHRSILWILPPLLGQATIICSLAGHCSPRPIPPKGAWSGVCACSGNLAPLLLSWEILDKWTSLCHIALWKNIKSFYLMGLLWQLHRDNVTGA